jgi:peptide/nickel transport system permease protein
MIAVGVTGIPTFARLARASTLSQKAFDYVEADRAIGSGPWRIIFRSILPNAMAPILVQMSLAVGYAILLEAALSFFGLGTQPPTSSWGVMLSVSRGYLHRAPWYAVFPGVIITLLVLSLNTFTDGLRDALDPTHRRVVTLE